MFFLFFFSLGSDSGESSILPKGKHEFPFAFRAPDELPSSYESKYGHVRYVAKAYLDRPWKFDVTCKRAFSLVGLVDLNCEPLAFTPGFGRTEQKFSFTDRLLSCMRGGLSVEVKIPRSAFVPGELIPISAEILNNSSQKVKRVESYITQVRESFSKCRIVISRR